MLACSCLLLRGNRRSGRENLPGGEAITNCSYCAARRGAQGRHYDDEPARRRHWCVRLRLTTTNQKSRTEVHRVHRTLYSGSNCQMPEGPKAQETVKAPCDDMCMCMETWRRRAPSHRARVSPSRRDSAGSLNSGDGDGVVCAQAGADLLYRAEMRRPVAPEIVRRLQRDILCRRGGRTLLM